MFAIRASASDRRPGLVLAVTTGINAVMGNVVGAELRVIEGYGFMTVVFMVDGGEQEVIRTMLDAELGIAGKHLSDFDFRVLTLNETPFTAPYPPEDGTDLPSDELDVRAVVDLVDEEYSVVLPDKGNVADVTCGSAGLDEPALLHEVAIWLQSRAKIVDLSAAARPDNGVQRGEIHMSVVVPPRGRTLEGLRSEFEAAFDTFIHADSRLWWDEMIHWGLHRDRIDEG